MLKKLSKIKKNISASIIAVINIGDIRTFCTIYRVFDNNNYKILAIESVFTNGFDRGVIVDLKKASNCLSELLNKSEKSAKARIVDVVVSAPTDKTSVNIYPFTTSINKEITQNDIAKLLDVDEYSSTLGSDEMILSLKYSDIYLDGKKVENPIGMYASKLSTDITVVKCFEPYIINILNLFEYLSLNLISIIHSSQSLPYLLDTEKSNKMALFINIDANATYISISNKSKIVYYKVIENGVNNILNESFKNLGIGSDILEEKEIYDMSFAEFKNKIVKFTSQEGEIKVHSEDINKELDKVITSFFDSIMLELKHIDMKNISNISVIGECSNLLTLNTSFYEQVSSNTNLLNKLKDENITLKKPLESVAVLSIIKYYLSNYKTDNTLKVLGKKLKDLLY